MDIVDVFEAVVKGEKVDRIHEEVLYDFLVDCVGDGNVLTEILYKDKKIIYFGCAVRIDGKWKVYNLIGTGGVVVNIANRPYLAMKVGE